MTDLVPTARERLNPRAIRAQTDMQLVAVGSNGRDAVAIAADLRPDVVDIRMPVLDEIAATREILGARDAPGSGTRTASGPGAGDLSGPAEQVGPELSNRRQPTPR